MRVLHELKKDEYKKILPLFSNEPLTYFPIVMKAIVEGNTAGRLWVDDANKPTTLLMWDEGSGLGLAGYAGNTELNKELAALVSREIALLALAKGNSGFKMYYTDGWQDAASSIFKDSHLQKLDRTIATLYELRIAGWRDNIPAGCYVRGIDIGLLQSDGLANLGRVKEEIACCWTSVDHFLDKGFSFCLITDDKIAAWCTAEYASGMDCGIGIETVEECQGRGFATLTACAFVEHCMSNGLTPYWDAWKSNLASVAIAEKVGFRKVRDYSVFLGRFAPS